MLTGTLGPNANYPCPHCKVHTSKLSSLTVKWPAWTSEDSHSTFQSAMSASTKKRATEILSSAGLAGVPNAFWALGSDPHAMVSYDKLHFNDLGLWGDHIWPLCQGIIEGYPKFIRAKFEQW
ncbi:uncharacterized protein EI90DRAFT_2936526 [Cantharellus anzutake]|uniref:uncharacterized protein n=1 Tax=Cantharellus anzutake TaxID=1750568 RepID=UPI0019079A19|nr:uncharacterized protein EI90DRAFT_2936526 [Cantharellus anzutake]KAF8322852.1 hypothetical protein EI90DRAFT_2936526 [Cantharellus anzutake]